MLLRCEKCGKQCRRLFGPAKGDDLHVAIAGSPCADKALAHCVWIINQSSRLTL